MQGLKSLIGRSRRRRKRIPIFSFLILCRERARRWRPGCWLPSVRNANAMKTRRRCKPGRGSACEVQEREKQLEGAGGLRREDLLSCFGETQLTAGGGHESGDGPVVRKLCEPCGGAMNFLGWTVKNQSIFLDSATQKSSASPQNDRGQLFI